MEWGRFFYIVSYKRRLSKQAVSFFVLPDSAEREVLRTNLCEAPVGKHMNNILIKNGTVVTSKGSFEADVLVDGDTVKRIAPGIAPSEADTTYDATGCIVTQGLADLHVHLREPGFSEKETIRTGSAAAARGGFTLVCPMPNLNPAPDAPETLAIEQEIIDRDAVIGVVPYATITKGRAGKEVVDVAALKPLCAAFSDDGSGVQNEETMLEAMQKIAAAGGILAAHCEDNALLRGGYIHDGRYAKAHGHAGICSESEWGPIVRDLELSAKTGCRYHVCHVSAKESVEAIRRAKARGIKVTCETAPHYLALTEDDLQEEGRFKMNPPLRSAEDREALRKGLADGTIDVIATDHAPHTAEQKSRGLKGSAMGIVGLETAFPVAYTTLVRTGIIGLERLVEAMCEAPRRIFGFEGAEGLKEGARADIAVFDIANGYSIDSSEFASKGRSTPFEGMRVHGRCVLTLYKGKKV